MGTPLQSLPVTYPATDPPAQAVRLMRPLTRAEQQSILSGGGYWLTAQGLPTPESNPEMHPFFARGLYPHPGHYETMARRNPIIAAGLTRIEYYVASLDWRVMPPENPTVDEKRHAEQVAEDFDNVPGGLSSTIRQVCTAVGFGFSAQELVWYEGNLHMGIADLVWIRPATAEFWVVNQAGDWMWFIQRSERGHVPIPRGKLLHFAWRGRSRAPEGNSALRPLYYYDEAKREILINDQISRQRYGIGTLVWSQPEGGAAEGEIAAVEEISQLWQAGQQAYLIPPPGWTYTIEFGGSIRPDPRQALEYFDHQASRLLDDTLAELGMARYGSHAVGSEMRLATQRQLTGVCREIAKAIDQQVIARVYRANGWTGRKARMLVTGFEDSERLMTIAQLAQNNLIDTDDRQHRTAIARAVGLQT